MTQPDAIDILLVEDDRIDVLSFQREVAKINLPYNYVIAGSLAEAHECVTVKDFDMAILDYNLGDGTSEELLPILTSKGIPAIVDTGSGDEETAAMIVRSGAYDYLLAGDDCLVQVAQAMQQVICRSSDLLARYGGEEFAILLPNTDLEGAIFVAEKLQQAIRLLDIPHEQSNVKPIITCSLGLASIIPTNALQPEELVKLADTALYNAKQQGRNRICPS